MTQFRLIGHACVLLSNDEFHLLTDPWFGYDIHFQTLFAYPPIQPPEPHLLEKINAIHISHIHQDHLCARSLSLVPKSSQIIITRHDDKRFRDRIYELGFRNILEAEPFKEEVSVGPFRIQTFTPSTFDGSFDSSAMISDTENSFYLMNDCRLSKDQYQHIKSRYPSIQGCFLNYNSLNPYPTCYEFQIPEYPQVSMASQLQKNQAIGLEHFESLTRILDPEWVAPYASNIRFLSKNLFHHNRIFEGMHEKAKELLNEKKIVEWQPQDLLDSQGLFLQRPQPLMPDPTPVITPPTENPENSNITSQELKDLLTLVWQRNLKRLDHPLNVSFVVHSLVHSFRINFSQSSSATDDPSFCPDMTIEYKASDLACVLNQEMTFSNLHYAYRFRSTIHRVIPSRCLIHQWQ